MAECTGGGWGGGGGVLQCRHTVPAVTPLSPPLSASPGVCRPGEQDAWPHVEPAGTWLSGHGEFCTHSFYWGPCSGKKQRAGLLQGGPPTSDCGPDPTLCGLRKPLMKPRSTLPLLTWPFPCLQPDHPPGPSVPLPSPLHPHQVHCLTAFCLGPVCTLPV